MTSDASSRAAAPVPSPAAQDRPDRSSPHVLAVHRYYWPDTPPYASMLREIVRRWSMDGLEVEVLSSQPSYQRTGAPARPRKERVDGVTVRRVRLASEHGRRWIVPINVVVFSAIVALRVLLSPRRFDVVMASTAPPVVLAWVASGAARLRGGKFVYHCMDVHPEIGRVSGEFSSPVIFRLLQRLDRATCATAAAVVVLSSDMASSLARRHADRRIPVQVINNFELGEAAPTQLRTRRPGHLRVVFTGNIGRFQGLDTAVAALGMVRRAKVQLVLMGAGSAVEALRTQAMDVGGADVVFVPHGDVAAARALIATADLGLVSLTGGIHRFAYPSKTMTYLAEGCPVLAVVEPDCELVGMLNDEGLGVTVSPGDAQGLAKALDRLADEPEVLAALHARARTRGPSMFDKDVTLGEWSRLLADILEPRAA